MAEDRRDRLYTIILVDDEDEVRGRISSRISKETGFAVVGTAGNGYDALELIEEKIPDVVLTDIKMPYIDGIELATTIRRDYPTVKMAFITGYNEFDYAREAVNLRIHSYLTKPLTEEAIREFLSSLKRELDEEYESTYSRRYIERQYNESVPLLIEHCLSSLLLSTTAGDRSEVGQLRQLGVDLEETRYTIISVSIERNAEHWDVIEFEKLRMSVRGNIKRTFDQEEIEFFDLFFNENIVYVVKESEPRGVREIDLVLNQIVRSIERYLSVRLSIGVGALHRGFRELRYAYDEAARALENGRVQSPGRIVYAAELPEVHRTYATLSETEIETLAYKLRYETPDLTKEHLARIGAQFSSVSSDSETGVDQQVAMLQITTALVQYGAVVNADIGAIHGTDLIETIGRMKSLPEFIGWAGRIVDELYGYGKRNRAGNAEKLLNQAISFMQQNVANKDLTMQAICDAQGISVSYLGQLFKKYKNTTFVKYLTTLRMERAKEQLRVSGNRIIEVAEACGYRDVYYFSHCFRKHIGVPPKTYRESHQ